MPRPVTLFTGQWADLTFDTVCAKASSFGYDGIEIACWGDHLDVEKALSSDAYLALTPGHPGETRLEMLCRSATIWPGRRSVTASTNATSLSFPPVFGGMAKKMACAAAPRKK